MYFFENTTFCACLYYHHRILSILSRTFVIWSHVFVPQDMTFLESRAIKKSRFSFCCSPLFSWWSTRKHFFTNEVGTQLIIMSFSGTFVLCLVIAYSMKWYLFRDTGSRVPNTFFNRSNEIKTYFENSNIFNLRSFLFHRKDSSLGILDVILASKSVYIYSRTILSCQKLKYIHWFVQTTIIRLTVFSPISKLLTKFWWHFFGSFYCCTTSYFAALAIGSASLEWGQTLHYFGRRPCHWYWDHSWLYTNVSRIMPTVDWCPRGYQHYEKFRLGKYAWNASGF